MTGFEHMVDLDERRRRRRLRASRTKRAAQDALGHAHPCQHDLNEKSRCALPSSNLVGVSPALWDLIHKQLGGGGGGELRPDRRGGTGRRPKFCSAWSSAALACSAMAPFIEIDGDSLRVPAVRGVGGPGLLQFEAKRSAGVPRRRWPNLDLVIDGPDESTFLESKATEYLSLSHAPLADIYGARAEEILPRECAREIRKVVRDNHRY